MTDARALCENCGHRRALHLSTCAVSDCTCKRFVDATTSNAPQCVACGRPDGVQRVIMQSADKGLNVNLHFCGEHLRIYAFHTARVLTDLMRGRLSIP